MLTHTYVCVCVCVCVCVYACMCGTGLVQSWANSIELLEQLVGSQFRQSVSLWIVVFLPFSLEALNGMKESTPCN